MAEGGDQDPAQKTEDPTPKRLEDAKKKGQVITSREVGSFLLLLFLALMVASFSPFMLRELRMALTPLIAQPDLFETDFNSISDIMRHQMFESLRIMSIPFGLALLAGIVANYAQHGNILTAESMKPKLDRISLIAGTKRLVSMRSLMEFLKGVVKITIVAVAIWVAVGPEMTTLKTLPDTSLTGILAFLMITITKALIAVCICMFFIALLDYLYQRYEFMKNMKMSMQEIKDEYKQQEGDPHVKQKLRQIRAERAQNRMMQSVPQSDVVITNPTHFAVALKYESGTMQAPIVVAKGADLIAAKIREIAEENEVPLVRNPPLARALFDSVELEQEVPLEHYKAVAEVISYIYKLKRKAPKKRLGMGG